MIDFFDFEILTITSGDRLQMFNEVMLSAMSSISNCRWHIVTQNAIPLLWDESFDRVLRIAKLRNIEICIYPGSPVSSVAREKILLLKFISASGKMIIMIDDDVIVPAETFEKFRYWKDKLPLSLLFTATQFDITNVRGHKDWNDKIYLTSEYEKFCDDVGVEHVATHLWQNDLEEFSFENLIIGSKIRGAGVFAVDYNVLVNDAVICDKLFNWQRGIRGYDVYVQKYFQDLYPNRCHFIFGANTYHIGLEKPFYNENWKTMNEEIKI